MRAGRKQRGKFGGSLLENRLQRSPGIGRAHAGPLFDMPPCKFSDSNKRAYFYSNIFVLAITKETKQKSHLTKRVNQERTGFAQVSDFLPKREFRRGVARYQGKRRICSFTGFDLYVL